MSSNKWSVERIIKFLEIYEQHPCLWDIRLDAYKDREMRKEAYEKIAEAMELDDFGVLDVRTKIRTLRNSYTLELAKILKSKKSGLSDESLKPKLAWFPVAERFFSKVARAQSTEPDTHLLCESKHLSTPAPSLERHSRDGNLDMKQQSKLTTPPAPHPEKESRDDIETEIQSVSVKTSSHAQDDYDIFGAFVATELRGLEDFSKVRTTKKKIQCAILEAYEPQATPVSMSTLTTPSEQQSQQISPSGSVQINETDEDPIYSAIKTSIMAGETLYEDSQGY